MSTESAPNSNNQELNPSAEGMDVGVGKSPEIEFSPEELEEMEAEKRREQELPPKENLKNLEEEVELRQREIMKLTESVEETKMNLNKIREELGLPQIKEDPPSVFSEKDNLEKLKAEQDALEKQKEEIISQQEKEWLIQEEKEKILQEKLDGLFKEFEALTPRDFESIFKNGKTREGGEVKSQSMGELDPKIAKSLAKAFKEGVKSLPKILEALPELLKKFDEDLTKEAAERVDKKLEEEKQKMEEGAEGQTEEEKPEISKEKISFDGAEAESSAIEAAKFEVSNKT